MTKKMTKKEISTRLYNLVNEAYELSAATGKAICLNAFLPSNYFEDGYVNIRFGEIRSEKENSVSVFPVNDKYWRNVPEMQLPTFDYFKACKYMDNLLKDVRKKDA